MVDCKICENVYCAHHKTNRKTFCNGYKAPKNQQTYADRIRSMSDEELADFIQHIRTNTLLAEALGVPVTREKDLEFVRQPVKDGDSE